MTYWLVKSEPSTYSWEQLVKDKKTIWDGVRNYAARNNLKAMKKGDEALYYHSNEGMEVVGVAQISKEFFQDPTTEDANWVSVELKPLKKLRIPVGLQTIKTHKKLGEMALVKNSRLSVQPVTEEEWKLIMQLADGK